jgi:hypothetical protein
MLRRCRQAAFRFRKAALWAAVILGVVFRVGGAVVNTEANDDHMEVIRVLSNERRIPAPDEFWEAFQPLLYHATVASALVALPELPPGTDTKVAQGISCAAGLLTLFILTAFVRRLNVSEPIADVAIALASLNPALISVSIQATNDAFVILFVTIGLAGGYTFFRRGSLGAFVVMAAGVLLACISKGNGLVLAIAATLTLAGAFQRSPIPRRTLAAYAVILTVMFAAVVPVAGGYASRYRKMGNAFAINNSPSPPPEFLEDSFEKRPGITSIVSGFFTFRLVSMLEDPLLEAEARAPEAGEFPRHRTSLWSLLYGGAHSVHYAYYPPAWRVPQGLAERLVRTTVLLALLPTMVLAIGLVRGAFDAARESLSTVRRPDWSADLLLVVTAGGYLGFVALYGYRYRDFATMKAIFICPAVLAFLMSFARELERRGGQVRSTFLTTAYVSSWLLCGAYVADVGTLLYWLSRNTLT